MINNRQLMTISDLELRHAVITMWEEHREMVQMLTDFVQLHLNYNKDEHETDEEQLMFKARDFLKDNGLMS